VNWILNELLIVFLRLALVVAMFWSELIMPICDRLIAAREKRPAWLSDWLDKRRMARSRRHP
jgi:hypothetical protein